MRVYSICDNSGEKVHVICLWPESFPSIAVAQSLMHSSCTAWYVTGRYHSAYANKCKAILMIHKVEFVSGVYMQDTKTDGTVIQYYIFNNSGDGVRYY